MKIITTFNSAFPFLLILFSSCFYSGAAWSEEVRVAVRAHSGVDRAMKKWGPTIDYLNQALPEYQFKMLPYISLKRQIADARLNKFELILTNPATYVELEVLVGAKALLTLINNRRGTAQTQFGSVIFTHVDNTNILKLEDLKGKSFMGVNPIGFGGWRVGLKVLKEHGIDPDRDFTSVTFPGKQPRVVEAVLSKKVHAGMVRTDMLERLADKGKVDLRTVRVLNPQSTQEFPFFRSSPLYPEWPFASLPKTDERLVAQVKRVLKQIGKNHTAAKAGKYMGWTDALDYEPVKKLLTDLGVEPFSKPSIMKPVLIGLLVITLILIAIFFSRRYSNR